MDSLSKWRSLRFSERIIGTCRVVAHVTWWRLGWVHGFVCHSGFLCPLWLFLCWYPHHSVIFGCCQLGYLAGWILFTNFGVRASENSSWLPVSHGTLECHVIACRRFWWEKKSSKHRSPYSCSSSRLISLLLYMFNYFFLFGPCMPIFKRVGSPLLWYFWEPRFQVFFCLLFGMEAYFHCFSQCFRASSAFPMAFTSPDT